MLITKKVTLLWNVLSFVFLTYFYKRILGAFFLYIPAMNSFEFTITNKNNIFVPINATIFETFSL